MIGVEIETAARDPRRLIKHDAQFLTADAVLASSGSSVILCRPGDQKRSS
jgi:hypothetical protein